MNFSYKMFFNILDKNGDTRSHNKRLDSTGHRSGNTKKTIEQQQKLVTASQQ
jgi:hypothetical protein